MKSSLIAFILLSMCSIKSFAFDEGFDKGYQIFYSSGIVCSSGTVIDITGTLQASSVSVLPGYNMGGYRIQNQDSSYSVWIANDINVSTTTASSSQKAVLGEKLIAGANGVWPVSRDQYSETNTKIYCRAEDSAGASGVVLSVVRFGYR